MNKRSTHRTPEAKKYMGGGYILNNQLIDKIAKTTRTTVLIMATLLLSGFSLSAQQRVTGTVSDDTGAPLPGANVTVVGTGTGTLTDISGAFSINVPGADASLEVSFVGYLTQTVPVGNRTTIQITLQTDATAIEDVVVIGYGTMQKRQVTSSIQSIGGDDLPVGVGGTDISGALVGKIAGLMIQGNDSPNSSGSFQLRGMASVNASRGPMFIIDGLPGADPRSLNPEDIESIDVLKDASAGAIYGSRATGGVILVTTKRAKTGNIQLSYTGELTYRQAYKLPQMLNAQEYLSLGGRNDFGGETDWMKEGLNDNPFSHRHNVTMQGGTDKMRVLLSLGYNDATAIVKFDNRKDYNGRFNMEMKFFDGWLDLGANVTYRQAARDQRFDNQDMEGLLRTNPTQPLYDPNSQTGYNVWTGGDDTDVNKIAEMALQTREGLDKWFRPDFFAKVNILAIPGLSYRQSVAYENRQWENHEYDPSTMRSEINSGRRGTARLDFSKTEHLNADGYFTYLKDFGKHSINATLGYSYFERDSENFWMRNRDFSVDAVKFWNMGNGTWYKSQSAPTGEYDMSSSKDITQRLTAYFARVNWSYDDKYMASASIRREGTSKLPSHNRWGNFWAVSAGWRISRENFMERATWLDDLKLRVAYGVTGNEGFGADYAARMFGTDAYWLMPNGRWAQSYGAVRNINNDLKWEERKETNIGLDFAMFNNRLWGSIDWFDRTVDGMIYSVDVPQPPYTQDKMFKNIGVFGGRGFDLQLGGDIVRGKNWTYTTSLNLSHSSTKVRTLFGDGSYMDGDWINNWVENVHRLEEGVTVGQFWLYRHAGFKDGRFQIYNSKDEVIFTDDASRDDRVYMGNATPALMAGWTHNLRYKNLSLDVTLTSWIDFDIYNAIELEYGLISVAQGNLTKDVLGRDKHITGRPSPTEWFMYDGTFLKIQNMTLGYNLPMQKYTKHIRNIKVYLTINNLATFTKYPGLNPQLAQTNWSWQGVERKGDLYPQTRSFILGAQLSF